MYGFLGLGRMGGGLARNLLRAGKQVLLYDLIGLDLALKDVRLGCEMARAWGSDARIMQATLECFERASAEGLGGEDCNAVYKVIE